MMVTSSVAIVKGKENIKRSIAEGLKFIGDLQEWKSPVLIKPNICTIKDKTGFAVTDVRVVDAIIALLLERDDKLRIRIIESDSQSKFADDAFKKFGYADLTEGWQKKGADIALINLSQSPVTSIRFEGRYFTNPKLPQLLFEGGSLVSVAVAKTHYLTFITGVLKNLFGLLPRKDQAFYHAQITAVIADLNRLVPPNLCIVDARVGLEGWNGPRTHRLDTFIVGYDPVAVDATLARIMGFAPEQIDHLMTASQSGIGSLDPRLYGEPLDSVKTSFTPPR